MSVSTGPSSGRSRPKPDLGDLGLPRGEPSPPRGAARGRRPGRCARARTRRARAVRGPRDRRDRARAPRAASATIWRSRSTPGTAQPATLIVQPPGWSTASVRRCHRIAPPSPTTRELDAERAGRRGQRPGAVGSVPGVRRGVDREPVGRRGPHHEDRAVEHVRVSAQAASLGLDPGRVGRPEVGRRHKLHRRHPVERPDGDARAHTSNVRLTLSRPAASRSRSSVVL